MKNIAVGQTWATRDGSTVEVTYDRSNVLGPCQWRWALSNSNIADEDGRVSMSDVGHPSDLVRLTGNAKVVLSQTSIDGMDSTMKATF
jgi:hypothetical protein